MSELIHKNDNRATIRWKLLTGVSALALAGYITSAHAEDVDQPQVWIELGGQLSRIQDNQETFSPTFETMRSSDFSPSEKFEGPPLYSLDQFAQLSFQPKNSEWVFSASVKYGRATKNRHVHQQTYPSPTRFDFYRTIPPSIFAVYFTPHARAARAADTRSRNTQQYTVLDFQAGKDVGLGLFGTNTKSAVSLGVRFAQFRDKSNIALRSNPDWRFEHKYFTYYGFDLQTVVQPYHSNAAGLEAERSFRGVGPSLSWNSSTPFAGSAQNGELTFDWGLNAAMLFGRQKTRTQHHATVRYNDGGMGFYLFVTHGTLATVNHTAPPPQTRTRNVTVPNVGGFAALSYTYADAKISLGYKADFFFGAIDGGIDTAKKENRGFYGPYASISIGLGD